MHDILKKKNMQKKKKYKKIQKKKNQKQNDQKCFKNYCKACILGDTGVIGCTLKVIVSIKQL